MNVAGFQDMGTASHELSLQDLIHGDEVASLFERGQDLDPPRSQNRVFISHETDVRRPVGTVPLPDANHLLSAIISMGATEANRRAFEQVPYSVGFAHQNPTTTANWLESHGAQFDDAIRSRTIGEITRTALEFVDEQFAGNPFTPEQVGRAREELKDPVADAIEDDCPEPDDVTAVLTWEMQKMADEFNDDHETLTYFTSERDGITKVKDWLGNYVVMKSRNDHKSVIHFNMRGYREFNQPSQARAFARALLESLKRRPESV